MTATIHVQEHGHERGRGESVLLLHGTPSASADFAPLVDALADRFRVLVPDLPGYGTSVPLPAPYSFEAARAALESMLRDRGVERCAIVGFSGGAYRAFDLALAGAVRVDRLVSIGGLAGLDDAARPVFRGFADLVRSGADLRALMVQRMLSPAAAEDPRARAAVEAWLTVAPANVLADELDAFANAPDLRPRLRGMRIPVLVRSGALDGAAPPPVSEELARLLPDARLELVAEKGHALLLEDRDATIDSVRRFLLASA